MGKALFFGSLTLVAVLALSVAMRAADNPGADPSQQTGNTPSTTTEQGTTKSEAMANSQIVWQASDVIGLDVQNKNSEKLGKIQNLAIDGKTGLVRYAIVSSGSTMGIGGKLTPVPWRALQFTATFKQGEATRSNAHCVFNVNKNTLANAPSFKHGEWPNFANRQWTSTITEFYRPILARQTNTTEGTSR